MMNRLFFWALTSALAGFLFGFDTVVISGAEQTIQSLWGLNKFVHGLAMSAALWGTVLGSLLGFWPTDRLGRKNTLLSIGVLYFVSAVWSALAQDVFSFMVARFIGGLGVGISTVAAPLYIAEISPANRRGRLAGMFQFNIVFGILIAFVSNYVIRESVEHDAWRWMLGIEAVPALIYSLMCFALPQSPRWLIACQQNRSAGEEVLRLINPDATEDEIRYLADQIEASAENTAETRAARSSFWSSQLRTPILLAFLVAFFNQMSGINAILYFAPRIFQLAGLGESAALLNSVGIGITNLIFTFVGLYLIDRLGRRTLLFIGSLGYIASLGLCAWAFFAYAAPFRVANTAITVSDAVSALSSAERLDVQNEGDITKLQGQLEHAKIAFAAATADEAYAGTAVNVEGLSQAQVQSMAQTALEEAATASGNGGNLVLFCIFAFIAAHAVGQGAVIWVLISEIFPNQHRASGQALGSFTHWIFAALLTMVFPWMISTFEPGYVFGLFCGMMVLQLLWVLTMVPETKGVSLEDMQQKLGVT